MTQRSITEFTTCGTRVRYNIFFSVGQQP